MYPCLASSGLDTPLDFSLDFPLDFALDGCDFGVISQIKALNPLIVTDPALLNSANIGRPIPQRTMRRFNGTTQYTIKAVSDYRSGDASGAIEVTFSTTATGTNIILNSSNDVASGDNLSVGIRESGNVYIIVKVNGVNSGIKTVNSFNDGLTHTARYISNGSAFSIEVDGALQTTTPTHSPNEGWWFGDVIGRDNLIIGAFFAGGVSAHFDGTISQVIVYDPSGNAVNQWELVENGGSIMRDALGVHDLTYVNNPVVTTDNTAASDPLNERGFTEGTGSNGAAIGEYLVARLDAPAIDVGGNATQWVNTAYPVLANITGGTAEAFTALNTNVADDGNQTPAILRAGLPATWTQGDPNVPRFQTKDNGDSTSSLALGLPADPTPTEQISIDKYHE